MEPFRSGVSPSDERDEAREADASPDPRPAAPDLVQAIRELTAEIRSWRASSTRATSGAPTPAADAFGEPTRVEMQNIIQGLLENIEELESDNAALREEVERLLAAGEGGSTDGGAPPPFASATETRRQGPASLEQQELIEENVRLREHLARSRASDDEARAMLHTIDTSRAWRIVSAYWTLARRMRGRRSDSPGTTTRRGG
jgi:hypothetical protein